MNLLSTIILSFVSLIVLFLLTRIMGYRQISQMSTFDYINGITIGSIAAEMATSSKTEYVIPLTATILYALAVAFLSYASSKSIRLRRFIVGKPIVLLNDGVISKTNLAKAKIDLNEFLTQCRVNGYFDISHLQSVVLEPDGRFSILAKSEYRPLIPSDLKLSIEQNYLVAVVIEDGHIMEENLKHMRKDTKWLTKQLKQQKHPDIEQILLATLSHNDVLTVYPQNGKIDTHSLLI